MWAWFPARALPISATTSAASTRTRARSTALQPRRDADLRARPERARGEERAREPAVLHDRLRPRRCARPRRCSSRSARRRGAATAMRTSPTSTQAAREIAAAIDGYTVIVTKSTVPVGTGDEVERIIREIRPGRGIRRRVEPGIPARRRGDRRLQAARPHRHRHRGRRAAKRDDASSTGRSTSINRRCWSRRGARPN